MAAKDSNDKSKTSKTARVMNLLSKKHDPSAEEAAETGSETTASVPPIIASMAPDAAVSGQIKDALTDFLETELGVEPEQAAAPAPEQPTEPVQEAAPPAEPPVAQPQDGFAPLEAPPAHVEAPAPEPQAVQEEAPIVQEAPAAPPAEEIPETVPQPSPALLEAIERGDTGTGYVNVMQILVEEKAEKYVKLFGLCDCERCMADVKALALNHLPPKYVVMDRGERVPKLTFYEGKFDSEIITQLVQACKKIMQTPHHDRNH